MKHPSRTVADIQKALVDLDTPLRPFCAKHGIAYRTASRVKAGGFPLLENWMLLDAALAKHERAQRRKVK